MRRRSYSARAVELAPPLLAGVKDLRGGAARLGAGHFASPLGPSRDDLSRRPSCGPAGLVVLQERSTGIRVQVCIFVRLHRSLSFGGDAQYISIKFPDVVTIGNIV